MFGQLERKSKVAAPPSRTHSLMSQVEYMNTEFFVLFMFYFDIDDECRLE